MSTATIAPRNDRSVLGTLVRSLLLLVTIVLAPGPTVRAEEYIEPQLIQIRTPVYRPRFSEFDPALGTYEYTVSWQGIPAANASLSLEEQDGNYRAVATAGTYSGIDLLYKLRYTAEGIFSALDLLPVKTTITHQENSKYKDVTINFLENGEVDVKRVTRGKDTKELRFNPNNFMLDPFSAAFLARSLPWKVGDTHQFDAFNGKSRYLITLTAVERTTIDFDGRRVPVIVISPRVRNLTSKEPGKLREAKIYLTDDPKREILKIVSSVFIGSVTVELVKYTPAKASPSLRLAQLKREEEVR
jgi:hypothetical protein